MTFSVVCQFTVITLHNIKHSRTGVPKAHLSFLSARKKAMQGER